MAMFTLNLFFWNIASPEEQVTIVLRREELGGMDPHQNKLGIGAAPRGVAGVGTHVVTF